MLTDDEVVELAALRARAFGPDADLSDDSGGLARLAELEDRARADASANDAGTAGAVAEPRRPVAGSAAPPVGSAAPAPVAPVAPRSESPATVSPASPAPVSPAQPAIASTAAPHASAPVAAPRRRSWSRRAVLLVGIPLVAVACAIGAGVGAAIASPTAASTPAPDTTMASRYTSSFRSISEMHTWDVGSPRLLADLSGTLVWDGTTGSGTVTCVVVDDASQLPLSACQASDALTSGGVGVSVADPRTNATRTYVAWPNGAPKVTYYSDDPNPSP